MAPPLTRRAEYEQKQRHRAVVIATASTIIALVAVVVLVPLAPGWEKVKRSFFNWDIFVDSFPGLLDAFWLDIKILLWSTPFILIVALMVALARGARRPAMFPLRAFAIIYTDVLRGIPVILLVFLIGFGIPALGLSRELSNPVIWGTVTLILSYSAYVSEVMRAGIDSVHESQRAAARSLGMTGQQTMSSVVLPQAFRRIVPPLMNSFVSLQKDVALVSLIGPVEILRQAGIDKAKTANFTPYVAAAVIFLALTIPFTRLADWALARQRRRTGATTIA